MYAAAFVLTAALELYGTRLGTWAWAPHDPTGQLSAANPPSGIPGGYCWLDFWAIALAPLWSTRCSCAHASGSERKCAQTCSSGAIVSPKPASCS